MATEVKMPKLGIDMVDGLISRWLKEEGDTVEANEAIAEVETDKSTVEMEAPAAGVLLKIVVPPDELVDVGAVIAYIGEEGEAVGDGDRSADDSAAAAPSVEEAGDAEAAPADDSATEKQRPAPPDSDESKARAAPSGEPTPPGGVKASPVARRIAADNDIDLSRVEGSGPGGRIVIRDVEQIVEAGGLPAEEKSAPQAAPVAAVAAPAVHPQGESSEVPLSRMRKRITEVLTASKAPVPHFYVTVDVDMGKAMTLRQQMNESLAEEGIKISFNDLVVKATALALTRFPNINSSFAGDKIVMHGDINVGIAVSTEAGLLTIATRQTDKMSLSELSQVTRERADRAREGKMKADDMGDTTFTVSNLGMFGVDSFVAIITPPEAGILAVGGIRQEPVVAASEIVVGSRMRITISADHRVTDGVEAAEFVNEVKRLLENPLRMMV